MTSKQEERPNAKPPAPTSASASRRLRSFKRQLAAAFGSERQARLRQSFAFNSNSSHVSCEPPLDCKYKTCPAPGLSTTQASQRPTQRSRRRFHSPRHLIRMLAERHNDSSAPAAGNQLAPSNEFVSFIIETPTNAANFFATSGGGNSSSKSQLADGPSIKTSSSSGKTGARARDIVVPDRLNLPHLARSCHTVALASGRLGDRSRSAAPNARAAVLASSPRKQQQLSPEANKLAALLNQHDWRQARGSQVNTMGSESSPLVQLRNRSAQWRSARADHQPLGPQQDAMWELLDTEIHYIDRLCLIVDLFLATLEHIRASAPGLLDEVSGHQLASNVDQILQANWGLWSRHLGSASGRAGGGELPLSPRQLAGAFANISQAFQPYYRFCIEQSSCVGFVRRLALKSDCFRLYLAWCESQPECERMKLTDLLACPMQRLTRYSLLLRTILKQTPASLPEQQESLLQMITFTDKFVKSVDLELKRRDEFIKLLRAADRADLGAPEACALDLQQQQQIHDLLDKHHRQSDLMAPLFECSHACRRQLLFESSASDRLKFKDGQAADKHDVIVLIFTDLLLICKEGRREAKPAPAPAPQSPLDNIKRHSMRLAGRRSASTNKGAAAPASSSYTDCNQFRVVNSLDGVRDTPPVSSHTSFCSSVDDTPASAAGSGQTGAPREPAEAQRADTPSRPMRRRAASHSFLFDSSAYQLVSQRGDPPVSRMLGDACARLGADLFLSSARTILKVPSEQELVGVDIKRHLSRSSQQLSIRPAASGRQYWSHENSSNCSLISNQNSTCGSASQLAASGWRRFVSVGGISGGSHPGGGGELMIDPCQPVDVPAPRAALPHKLHPIRPPFAIDRLVFYELADRQSVLFCLLNESKTITGSFVLHWPSSPATNQRREPAPTSSRSPHHSVSSFCDCNSNNIGPPPQRLAGPAPNRRTNSTESWSQKVASETPVAMSQAQKLTLLVEESQVRYRAAAKLHGRRVALPMMAELEAEQRPSRAPSVYQNSLSLEVPNSPTARSKFTNQRSNDSDYEHQCQWSSSSSAPPEPRHDSWHLKLIVDQHQTYLLSHGLHHELASHEFTYTPRGAGDFAVSSRPIVFRAGLAQPARQQHAVARHDQFSNSNSVLVSVDSPQSAPVQTTDSSQTLGSSQYKISNDNLLKQSTMFAAHASARRDSSDKSTNSTTRPSSPSNEQNLLTRVRGSRRHLSSLKRQNVILSASCEQHQSSSVNENQSTGCVDSSSVDSLAFNSTTDESSAQHSRHQRDAVGRLHQRQSSSLQTSTIDQTLDEDVEPVKCHAVALRALEHELAPLAEPAEPGPVSMARGCQALRSISTDQTSSPIAVTLTVPQRRLNTLGEEAGGALRAGQRRDDDEFSCLDLKAIRRMGAKGHADRWASQRHPPAHDDSGRSRSRSMGSRLQLVVGRCLRPER